MKNSLKLAKKFKPVLALVTIIFVTFFITSAIVIAADWVGPTEPPPDGNLPGFIYNVSELDSSFYQQGEIRIDGSAAVEELTVSNSASIGSTLEVGTSISAPQICLVDDPTQPCRDSWPEGGGPGGLWSRVSGSNDIYYNSGNVGIGMSSLSNPNISLDVSSAIRAGNYVFVGLSDEDLENVPEGSEGTVAAANTVYAGQMVDTNSLQLRDDVQDILLIHGDGNAGFQGTGEGEFHLAILSGPGDGSVETGLTVFGRGSVTTQMDNTEQLNVGWDENAQEFSVRVNRDGIGELRPLSLYVESNNQLYLDPNGNVGVGSGGGLTEKLSVGGDVSIIDDPSILCFGGSCPGNAEDGVTGEYIRSDRGEGSVGFWSLVFGTNHQDRMIISGSDNPEVKAGAVGIGNMFPTAQLTIYDNEPRSFNFGKSTIFLNAYWPEEPFGVGNNKYFDSSGGTIFRASGPFWGYRFTVTNEEMGADFNSDGEILGIYRQEEWPGQLINDMDFVNNNVIAIFNNNGNVGIGTTGPQEKLEVNDQEIGQAAKIRITDFYDNPELQLQYGGGTNDHWSIYFDQESNELRFWNNSNNDILRITRNNNLILGSECEASGYGSVVLGNQAIVNGYNSFAFGGGMGPGVNISGDNSFALAGMANINGNSSFAFGGGTGNGIVINSDNSVLFGGEGEITKDNVFSIMSMKVGIDTTDPQATLDVNGDLNVSGSKNFVQEHPNDPTKLIRYTALEGPESGTYTRGSGQLSGGTATINLPEDFSLVTAEEGITVQVTPTSDTTGIYVVSKSNKQIVVKQINNGQGNATFDYLVQGVRIGYENRPVIIEKGSQQQVKNQKPAPEGPEVPSVQPAEPEQPDEIIRPEKPQPEPKKPVSPTQPQEPKPNLKWYQKIGNWFGNLFK